MQKYANRKVKSVQCESMSEYEVRNIITFKHKKHF